MILSENEVIQYLTRGENYGEHLRERRRFLETEPGCLPDELGRLTLAEEQFHSVMSAMWRIEPEERLLLLGYYSKRLPASAIAEDMHFSLSTFWRRRRRAFASLMRECGGTHEKGG